MPFRFGSMGSGIRQNSESHLSPSRRILANSATFVVCRNAESFTSLQYALLLFKVDPHASPERTRRESVRVAIAKRAAAILFGTIVVVLSREAEIFDSRIRWGLPQSPKQLRCPANPSIRRTNYSLPPAAETSNSARGGGGLIVRIS